MTPRPDDRPRCILFDLDGTLINTWHLYMEAFRRTLETRFQRRLSDAEIMDLHPHAERRLLLDLLEDYEFTPTFDRFLTHYASLHDELFGGFYDGVLDMLANLHRQGCLLGIVTGKSRDAWRITSSRLEDFNFEALFDVVLTDDDVQHPKPSPEGILTALDILDVDPAQAFYVGDSKLDGQAATAAGLPFGAALWAQTRPSHERFADPVRQAEAPQAFTTPDQATDFLLSLDRPRRSAPRRTL